MVSGINSFKEWFRGYESNYVIIGGTACDLLMGEAGEEFRVTRDIFSVIYIRINNGKYIDIILCNI